MKAFITFLLLFGLFAVMPPGTQASQTEKQTTTHFEMQKQCVEQAVAMDAVNYQFEKIDNEYTPRLELVADLPTKPIKVQPYICYVDVSNKAQNYNLLISNNSNRHTKGSNKADVYKERVRSDTRA